MYVRARGLRVTGNSGEGGQQEKEKVCCPRVKCHFIRRIKNNERKNNVRLNALFSISY